MIGERPVSGIYCCITNDPTTYCLKTRNIYYVTVFVGWEFGSSFAGWFPLEAAVMTSPVI